jgi:hypothetical protein
MSEDNKVMVKEVIDIMMIEGEYMDRESFNDKLTDLFNKNMHKAYEKFGVSLHRTKQFGWSLVFMGEREENSSEKKAREAKEIAHKKQVEAAELKEYLRLHKKYGKKRKEDNQQ